ncbi:octapeptide-repeat protein T2-like [Mya arenaria]|uniref:octapeptide-repeat protein T2-like n=1 Tax=Mya arenaria TaxID=6604 RepID=UPI0022E3D6AF|nr:octapeptide-repeat protein T2-like [Mya arenaria]
MVLGRQAGRQTRREPGRSPGRGRERQAGRQARPCFSRPGKAPAGAEKCRQAGRDPEGARLGFSAVQWREALYACSRRSGYRRKATDLGRAPVLSALRFAGEQAGRQAGAASEAIGSPARYPGQAKARSTDMGERGMQGPASEAEGNLAR